MIQLIFFNPWQQVVVNLFKQIQESRLMLNNKVKVVCPFNDFC